MSLVLFLRVIRVALRIPHRGECEAAELEGITNGEADDPFAFNFSSAEQFLCSASRVFRFQFLIWGAPAISTDAVRRDVSARACRLR